MEIISSKNIFILLGEILRLIDKRMVDHGSRVAYILYRMLEIKGGYEQFELAEFALIGLLHDIGAYKVENSEDSLRYETTDAMPHAVYGSLFLKYISPLESKSKIVMYSHTDYQKMESLDYPYKDISNYINLLERADLFHNALGSKYDYKELSRYVGTKYSSEAYQLFSQALVKYNVFDKFKTGEYLAELEKLAENFVFSDAEKRKYLEMLLFISDFQNDYSINNAITCLCVSREIAKRMNATEEDLEMIYYGALLHDLGMLALPVELIKSPRKFTPEEMDKVKEHVAITERILKGKIDERVLCMAINHHERMDGSGYPRGLYNQQISQNERIIQLADIITSLSNKRSYRLGEANGKSSIIMILNDEVNHNKFSYGIVKTFIDNYDEIMEVVEKESKEGLAMFHKLNTQYEQVSAILKNEKK